MMIDRDPKVLYTKKLWHEIKNIRNFPYINNAMNTINFKGNKGKKWKIFKKKLKETQPMIPWTDGAGAASPGF